MIAVGITLPYEPVYSLVQDFAKKVYREKIAAKISGNPDALSFVSSDGAFLGCSGIFAAETHHPLLLETYHPFDIREKFPEGKTLPREKLAEIGMKALSLPAQFPLASKEAGAALVALLVILADRRGISHIVFTANLSSVMYAKETLGFSLFPLGDPDTSLKNEAFRKNWERFFFRRPSCFWSYTKTALPGSASYLALLEKTKGVYLLPSITNIIPRCS